MGNLGLVSLNLCSSFYKFILLLPDKSEKQFIFLNRTEGGIVSRESLVNERKTNYYYYSSEINETIKEA